MTDTPASNEGYITERTWLALGTIVRIQVAAAKGTEVPEEVFSRAINAIHAVEEVCSRFDPDSELVRLMDSPIGRAVPVSPILYQSLNFALEIAAWTEGRFDPTVGARMEELGFKQHYLTGEVMESHISTTPEANYQDVELDAENQTVSLKRPVKLDLGAVAKGLAVDLAANELRSFNLRGFVIDAGGDIYVGGRDESDQPWEIGIRHPVRHDETILTLRLSDVAICTSGTYERPSPVDPDSHHILNAHSKDSIKGMLSLTAIGPYTMMADGLSTAAFLYPAKEALSILEEAGLEGVIIAEDLVCQTTRGMERYLDE